MLLTVNCPETEVRQAEKDSLLHGTSAWFEWNLVWSVDEQRFINSDWFGEPE